MQTLNQQPLRRYPAIDALRGVSVLLVVLHHVHLRFVLSHFPVSELLPRPLARVLFWSGYYAVVMFFVISGFLITHHSLRRWPKLPVMRVGGFYWLRFTRIYPSLLLLLAVLSCLHLAGVSGFVIDPARSSLGRAVLAALTFHFNWLEGTRGYLPGAWDVLWSLSVEEAFYLVFPLACVCLRREALVICAFALAIAIGPISRTLIGEDSPWDEYAYSSCVDCLSWGCLAAWLQHRVVLSERWRKAATMSALASGITLMLCVIVLRETIGGLHLTDYGLQISCLALGTALTLWGLATGDVQLRCSWLQAIGRHSYEIYLTHMLVVLAVVPAATVAWLPLFYATAVIGSLALGWVFARFFSQPLAAALRQRAPTEQPLLQPPAAR